jgi:hypothetical protein
MSLDNMVDPKDNFINEVPANFNLSDNSNDDYPIGDFTLPEYNPMMEELYLHNKLYGEGTNQQYFIEQNLNNVRQEENYEKYGIKSKINGETINKNDQFEGKNDDDKPDNCKNMKNLNEESEQIKNKKGRRIKKKISKKKIKKKKLITIFKKHDKFKIFKVFDPPGESEINKQIKKEILKILEKKNINLIFNIEYKEKKRKFMSDNIKKKIKARFLKSLKNKIQIKLDKANSDLKMDFLQQCFISDISKERNSKIINKTLKELMSTDFFDIYENEKNKDEKEKPEKSTEKERINKKKYENNLKTIEYLEKNKEIKEKINFDVIGDMTFKSLFNEYLYSKEFEEEILKLKSQESSKYVKDYIIYAYNFITDLSE